MYGHILMKLSHYYTLPGQHDTGDIFRGHGFKGQGHRQHFRKMHSSGGGIVIDGSNTV